MVDRDQAAFSSAADTPSLAAEVSGTRAGAIVFIGVIALNIGNAAFHLLSARILGPEQYSDVVSLLAASGLVTLPFSGVQYAFARVVSEDAARGDTAAVSDFIHRALAMALVAGAALTALLVALSPLIRSALGVQKLSPVVLAALYTLPALMAPALWGIAQGLQRFGLISASLVFGTVVRIGLLGALVPVGVGVGIVMGSTLVAGIAALLIPLPFILGWLKTPRAAERRPVTIVVRSMAPVIAGTLAITSLTTVDLIAAKVALPSHDAGVYGSASFIGRILLYLPAPIATVLLPKVASRAAAARDTRAILHASLAVTGVFSLVGTAIFVAMPHLIVQVSFGSKFAGAAPLLGLFGLAMTLYALLNVQFVYHLGHGRESMAWLLVGGAVAQIAVYGLVHGSTYQLIGANLGTAAVLVLIHEFAFEPTLPYAASWLIRRVLP